MSLAARSNRSDPLALPAPFKADGEHLAIDLPGARAMFTTRRGGFSRGPYESLNLGRLTSDDPDAVSCNRGMLQSLVGGRLAMIRQVHGARVLRLLEPGDASGHLPARELEEADGQATSLREIAPIVLTADCLPIAVAGGGVAAMLHAGWRGLAEGVIEEGVHAMRELGAEQPLAAAIGPGAGVCCYEVGEEVHQQLRSYGGQIRRGRNLDLAAIAREQLRRAGVNEVHDCGLCTICSPASAFFSHRRDHGLTGRQAGIVWLT